MTWCWYLIFVNFIVFFVHYSFNVKLIKTWIGIFIIDFFPVFFPACLFISMISVIEQSHKPVLNYLFPLISNNEQHGKWYIFFKFLFFLSFIFSHSVRTTTSIDLCDIGIYIFTDYFLFIHYSSSMNSIEQWITFKIMMPLPLFLSVFNLHGINYLAK
jgi:hypothetical protein